MDFSSYRRPGSLGPSLFDNAPVDITSFSTAGQSSSGSNGLDATNYDALDLSFSKSIFSRAAKTTISAKTSEGFSITLRKKKSQSSKKPSNDQYSHVEDMQQLEVDVNERNPGGKLNEFDNRNQFGIPIYQFKLELEKRKKEKRLQEDRDQLLRERISKHNDGDVQVIDSQPSSAKKDCTLLTEKYRPEKWIDLVGPEKTHRRLLKWLRHWSPLVFDTPGPTFKNNYNGNNNFSNKSDFVDVLSRPQKKILLIHGPPGIGKTTVAHVIANQAGYDVLEINASDERSASTVKDRIGSAVSSYRLSQSNKPVCIVADEIEGAAESGFIKALVDLITADARACSQIERWYGTEAKTNKLTPKEILGKLRKSNSQHMDEVSNSTNKRRKANKTTPGKILNALLMRPIIAVCNDAYASSLKMLRPYAEIVPYHKVSPYTLVDTLQQICTKEDLDISAKELTQIAIDSECDLRSCLNSLQFGYTKKSDIEKMGLKDQLLLRETPAMSCSKKDTSKSWSSVVLQLFQQRRGISVKSGTSNGIRNKTQESQILLREVLSCGEFDRMVTGAFLAYPHMEYHDDLFKKPVQFGDWLFFHDSINKGVYQNQHSALAEYYPYSSMASYTLFSNINNNSKSFYGDSAISLSEHEYFEKLRENKDLINSFFKTCFTNSPSLLQSINKIDFVIEILPNILSMVNPDFPNINSSFYSTSNGSIVDSEGDFRSDKISHTIEILRSYGMRYISHAVDNTSSASDQRGAGGLTFILDPPIEKVAIFDERERQLASVGKFSIRQTINTEIAKLESSLASEKSQKRDLLSDEEVDDDEYNVSEKRQKLSNDEDLNPRHSKISSTIKTKASSGGLFDFSFSKVTGDKKPAEKEKEEEKKKQKQISSNAKSHERIWIQYNEGLSNAVRRNLTWAGLWL